MDKAWLPMLKGMRGLAAGLLGGVLVAIKWLEEAVVRRAGALKRHARAMARLEGRQRGPRRG
ncbi:MAG: hypothetical protein TU35_007765 [Thermoproteus sp. AZ2]|uniref:Uncharacterized protein n=1 Tax=Thermoproteus sp. AZ2 TaxID=1609232 RepID=A0ACC6V2E8_9CREN